MVAERAAAAEKTMVEETTANEAKMAAARGTVETKSFGFPSDAVVGRPVGGIVVVYGQSVFPPESAAFSNSSASNGIGAGSGGGPGCQATAEANAKVRTPW